MHTRLAHILAFLLPALLALVLGLQAHGRALVDLDTIAAMGNAWRAFHWQDSANMALIGFDQPPLMALLFVPFAAFAPQMLVSGLAAPVLGAVFLGLSSLIIWRLGRSLGLPWWLALGLCGVFALHPLVLSYAMLGSRAMVLTFVLLGLSASLVSWQREQRVRDVLTGSFFAAAALLLAYETVVLVAAAAAYLAIFCRQERDREPAKAEGLLIAFLMPAAYVALVWIGANWAIMGNPWHFWPAPPEILEHQLQQPEVLSAALAVAVAANPLLLALVYHGLRLKLSGYTVPAAYLLLAALAAVLLLPHLSTMPEGARAWVQHFSVPAAALGVGIVLVVALVAQLLEAGRSGQVRQVLSPGLLIVACCSVFVSVTQHERLPRGPRSVLAGRPAFARDVTGEWALADRLREVWNPALGHLVRGEQAYVVALRAEARQNVVVLNERADLATYPLALGPGSYVALVEDLLSEAVAQRVRPRVLAPAWRQTPPHGLCWSVYQVRAAPPTANGQPPPPGAIIAHGAPDAHSRR